MIMHARFLLAAAAAILASLSFALAFDTGAQERPPAGIEPRQDKRGHRTPPPVHTLNISASRAEHSGEMARLGDGAGALDTT
jgi:hypothetical protein